MMMMMMMILANATIKGIPSAHATLRRNGKPSFKVILEITK